MNRFDIDWSVPLLVKCCISCLRIRELEKFLSHFMILLVE